MAGPRPGKILPVRWRRPGGMLVRRCPLPCVFRCETDSSVLLFREHCLHAFPHRANTNFLSSLSHTPVRFQDMCAFLPPYPLFPPCALPFYPVRPQTCALSALPPFPQRVMVPFGLVHSNMMRCSLFAFLSPKQYSQFLNTLRELSISLIRLGINSSKQF